MSEQNKENRSQANQENALASARSEPGIALEEFAHFFEGEDITEEEAREFLQIYWALALEIMSLGFGFHPVQQAKNTCGKLPESTGNPPDPSGDPVYLTQELISENFERAAGSNADRTGEGVET